MASSPDIVTKGVVLRETETRDADKILTLLTAERGKLSVIARGVCRKGCKFAACAQPLAYSEWTLYKKGDWYYANLNPVPDCKASLEEELRRIRESACVHVHPYGAISVGQKGEQLADLDAMALGFYLAELTEAVTTEDAPHQGLLSHLLNGLYAVSVLRKPLPLVKAAFEIKLLCLAGYEPLADACAYCGCPDPQQPYFDVLQGVLRCGTCGEGRRGFPLCRDSLAALRHIVYGDPKRLYSFTLGPEAQKRLSAAAEAFVSAQLERGFRTLDFYKSVRCMDEPS